MIRMFVSLNQDGSEIFLITIFGFFVEYWVVQQVVRLQEVTIFGWQHNFIIYKYVVLNLVACIRVISLTVFVWLVILGRPFK